MACMLGMYGSMKRLFIRILHSFCFLLQCPQGFRCFQGNDQTIIKKQLTYGVAYFFCLVPDKSGLVTFQIQSRASEQSKIFLPTHNCRHGNALGLESLKQLRLYFIILNSK